MRKSLALVPLLGLLAAVPAGAALIYNETFDTNGAIGANPRYTVTGGGTAAGNTDYWARDNGPVNPGFTGGLGTYFAGRHLNQNIGGTTAMPRAVQTTSASAVSLAGYTAATMSILLAASTGEWESDQPDAVRLYMVDYGAGGALTLLDTFLPTALVGGSLRSTAFGTTLSTAFARYTYALPITIGNIGFRLEASSTGDLEIIGFDDIQINATLVPEPATGSLLALGLVLIGAARRARHGQTITLP